MDKLRENIQKRKLITWIIVLVYIIFSGCFGFPFSNEISPFDFTKGYLIVASYGIIGLLFFWLLDKGKSGVVLVVTLFFTMIGLICRYFLEFGEASNTYNFIPINIALYLLIVPIYSTLVYYWCVCKFSAK